MPSFTIRIGSLLTLLGVASYVTTGGVSLTALIPAVIGVLLVLCGLVARRSPTARPHAMHAAALIALLGLFGTAGALVQLPALLAGDAARPPAVVARASLAVILLVYLAFSIKSFVDARLRRKA